MEQKNEALNTELSFEYSFSERVFEYSNNSGQPALPYVRVRAQRGLSEKRWLSRSRNVCLALVLSLVPVSVPLLLLRATCLTPFRPPAFPAGARRLKVGGPRTGHRAHRVKVGGL